MVVISLGDVLVREEKVEEKKPEAAPPAQANAAPMVEGGAAPPPAELQAETRPVPYLVMNPDCDLVRRTEDASVILVRGRFQKKHELQWPVNPEKHELIVIDEEERVLSWEYKAITSVPYQQLSAELEAGVYRCVARMRSIYALKQQRALATVLGRVGTEVPPHVYEAYCGDVFFRGAGKNCTKVVTFSVGSEAVVLAGGREGQGHQLFFLPDAIETLRTAAKGAEVHAETRAVFDDLTILRFLRGPIDLDKDDKPTFPGNEERLVIKFPALTKRDGNKQLEGKARVLFNLFRSSDI
jgi:hypothetical protein